MYCNKTYGKSQKKLLSLQISNSNNPAVKGNQWDVASLEGLAIDVLSDTLRYAKTVFRCLYFGTKNGWWFGHSKRLTEIAVNTDSQYLSGHSDYLILDDLFISCKDDSTLNALIFTWL